MPGANSSNLKKTCVNCHFFAYAMKYYSHKSNQYSEEVVDQYYRNWIREKCYNDNQSTEIPEECNYLRGYNNEKASDLYIVGLKCYKNVWPVIEYSIERIPRTLDIKTCSFLHTVPKYREKAFEEITEVDRSGSCFFCEYKRGMSFEAGVELERRAAQNNSITKPVDSKSANLSEQHIEAPTLQDEILKDTGYKRGGNEFVKKTDYWLISYEGETIQLTVSGNVGLEYIAHLLDNRGREYESHKLRNIVENKAPIESRHTIKYGQNDDGNKEGTDALPKEGPSYIMDGVDVVLDEEALKEYKDALKEYNEDLDEAKKNNDLGQIGKLEESIEFIRSQMVADVGLKGR
ncbi:MAG TPA: hypothetical protein QF423_04535, partial [Candidatus Scalindua sp.]|nr:hypothetical protein [Candidatus Scalindua sp.]